MQLERPQVIDLVAVGEFEAVFDREQRALDDLQRRAHETSQSAAGFERQLAEEGIHPETARWMMLRFNDFLRDLRAEVDEEVDAILDHARRLAVAPRVPDDLRLSFGGAFAARSARTAYDEIQWTAEPSLRVASPPRVQHPPVRAAVTMEAIALPAFTPTEPTITPPTVVSPQLVEAKLAEPASDAVTTEWLFDALKSRGDDGPSGFEAVAADTDHAFWADNEEPRSWWRRHARVSATALLTIAAVLVAALAVAVQVA